MVATRLIGSVIAACAVVAANAAFGADEEVTPAHVYQAVGKVVADIELIREAMGRPKLQTPPWVVDHAEPRHVFYQAQTLLRKANRLAMQLNGVERIVPTAGDETRPADVLALIGGVQQQVDAVRGELGLTYSAEVAELQPDRRPRDVLREVVQASRQLNLLLDRRIKPEDVYSQLELAAAYVAGALTDDVAVPVYGTLPPFEGGKQPADVYRRVMECLGIAQAIGTKQGIDVLQLNLRRELRRRDIAPADVYDLATTVLAELAYLTLVLEARDVDLPPVERPKHIFPSHVYRLAGMLQDELARLEAKL